MGLNESNLSGGELLDPGHYYGTPLAQRVTGDVTLSEAHYPSGSKIPSHAHRAPYFCLVLDGSFEETWGTHRETCRPGTLVFHLAHEVHADRFGTAGARCFNLELAPSLADRLADEGVLPPARLTLSPGRAGAMAAAMRAAGRDSALEIEEAVLGILAELGPRTAPVGWHGRRPSWVDRSVERLVAPAPPSVAALAAEAGVHPVYFTRVFRAAVRKTPSEVAREARLGRAAAALLASDAGVSTIAHEAGFADHSHFCRQFRSEFGVRPSDYRRLFRCQSPGWSIG